MVGIKADPAVTVDVDLLRMFRTATRRMLLRTAELNMVKSSLLLLNDDDAVERASNMRGCVLILVLD